MLRAFLDEIECSFLDHKLHRRKILDGSGGAPETLIAACAELKERYRVGSDNIDKWLDEWGQHARLSLAAVGLESAYQPVVKDLDNASPEDVEVLGDFIRDAAPDLMSNMDLTGLFTQFALLGLVERGDHNREGVRITRLGRLVRRSLVPA
jgi:hypothetical protein